MNWIDIFLIVWIIVSAIGWVAIILVFLYAGRHADEEMEEIFRHEPVRREPESTAGVVESETT